MVARVQPSDALQARLASSTLGKAGEASALDEVGSLLHETLGERVTGELRSLLIAGRLAPGEKLSLRRVAEALGVSMMPVREAVSRLAADKALEVLPGRAVRVPVLTLA
ncbi:MAG: GntR family transcriptional regulator, partial [Hyphomicrobiales bacterium]